MDNKLINLEERLNNKIEKMEEKFEKRFDRLEKKFDGLSVSLIETQETVDYLASKNAQHERKLRNIHS